MADRFLLFDYLTRQAIAELPVVDSFSYTETLNKPGTWSATIPLSADVGADDLYSSRAVLGFERAELLRWVGPVLTARADVAGGTLALSGEGFMNYLRRRVLHITSTFTATDQLLIVKNLIDYTQALDSGNLGINTLPLAATTTVSRDRTYWYYEKKKIGEAVEQLAEVRDGFDFRLVPRWANGPNSTYVLDFEVIFPALGRDTEYTFDIAAHDVTDIDVDLTRLAYRVTAVGQGTGEDIPSSTLTRTSLIAGNALLEDVVSVGDVTGTDTLADYARRRLDVGSTPLIYPNLVLDSSFLGSFIPGDRVHVLGGAGALDVGGVYRIAEQSFSLPADGAEVLALTLVPLAAWLEN